MTFDITQARTFVATNGRVLDRRRFDLILDGGDGHMVLAALDAYRNDDGGYGWGLEPDLRAPESQPVAAMHALEVLAEVAAVKADVTARTIGLCDWLRDNAVAPGALPLALPVADRAGVLDLWATADPTAPSLQMTTQLAANAQLVARHDPTVASHPWLTAAREWCLHAIRTLERRPVAHELLFVVRFLDAVASTEPDAHALLDRAAEWIPRDGVLIVEGGAPDEALRALDLSPRPGPSRRLFDPAVIAHELARLQTQQQSDGGFPVGFVPASPAAELEWRAYNTVRAVSILRAHAEE